jgi:hypothetical protein
MCGEGGTNGREKMDGENITYVQRKAIRAAAGLSGTPYTIVVEPGNAGPRLEGKSYYWTTPSGLTVVRHPNAYSWPKLYHPSTRRIVVGRRWVWKNAS